MLGAMMATEIAEQPETLERLLSARHDIASIASQIARSRPRLVMIAGRGTSNNAAAYAKTLVEASMGVPVGLASMSSLTLYRSLPAYDGVLWIAISQSGQSPDLVAATRQARRGGALTLVITNDGQSPLAEAAEMVACLRAGPEVAVAATKTYTSQLLAIWLLVDAWRGGDASQCGSLPELTQRTLELVDAKQLARQCDGVASVVCIGRGYSLASAQESALKIMETTYLPAQSFSAAELMHGPVARVDRETAVVAIVPPTAAVASSMRPILEHVRHRGSQITCVTGQDAPSVARPDAITLPGVDHELSPILEILPLQLMAMHMAVLRGNDPDRPRGVQKVTQTW